MYICVYLDMSKRVSESGQLVQHDRELHILSKEYATSSTLFWKLAVIDVVFCLDGFPQFRGIHGPPQQPE